MVSIFVAKTASGPRFFWNIDANVGEKSANRREDVQLVQFGVYCMQFHRDANAEEKKAYEIVVPGMLYQGQKDDPLSLAIRTFGKVRGGPGDGHVSAIKGTGLLSPSLAFMMVGLSNAMSSLMPEDYPRIDKHPRCPLSLGEVVRAFFGVD